MTHATRTVPSIDSLAEQLYETWRSRQDFVEPLEEGETWGSYELGGGRTRNTRPPWKLLTTVQQDVWQRVAEVATRAGLAAG